MRIQFHVQGADKSAFILFDPEGFGHTVSQFGREVILEDAEHRGFAGEECWEDLIDEFVCSFFEVTDIDIGEFLSQAPDHVGVGRDALGDEVAVGRIRRFGTR